MTRFRGIGFLLLLTTLLLAHHASAEDWQSDRYHLSMQGPADWPVMSDTVLAQTNAQVSHVTGRGFIAGYALRETNTLVFPYLLVQYKPYTALPEQVRPLAKLNEHDQLELLYTMVGAFRQKGPLPDTIDAPQFMDRFGNDHARLNRLEDDGRFDFAGKIPHEEGQDPIRYHTHGIFGKDGIAMVSVFAIDDFNDLAQHIGNEMRTLEFANGFGMAALPDEPPLPEPEPETTEPAVTEPEVAEPEVAETIEQPAPEPEAEVTEAPLADAADEPTQATQEAEHPGDSTALVIILSVLGVALLAVVIIVWYVTHKKAQAQRERRRARRERMLAAQGSVQVSNQPRPAASKAKSPGSTGRHRHGTTRS